MMSSHPDSSLRADEAKARAEKDGLYKAYVKKPAVTTPVKKATTTATKKKTTTTVKKK
jgi:metalloprotease